MSMFRELPLCSMCLVQGRNSAGGVLIPLSDYGPDGSSLPFKVWICTHPHCGYNLRIDKGQIMYGERPTWKDASMTPKAEAGGAGG